LVHHLLQPVVTRSNPLVAGRPPCPIFEVLGPDGDIWPGPGIAPYTLYGGLFELRLKAREGIARVLYCTMVERKIMVLHQFIKKSDRTPYNELAIARRRLKEIKNDQS
jgi:hypothetical protein